MEQKAKRTLPSPRRNLVPLLLCMKAVARCQCENHIRGFRYVPGRMHEPSSCWQGAPQPPVKQWDHTWWISTSHRAVVMVEHRSNSRRLVNDKASHEHQPWHIHLEYSVMQEVLHNFVIHAAGDLMYTVVHCRRPRVSGGRMPPLEQSAIWCYVSSNAHCFSESPQDTPLHKIFSCLTFNCFSVSYFLHSGQ